MLGLTGWGHPHDQRRPLGCQITRARAPLSDYPAPVSESEARDPRADVRARLDEQEPREAFRALAPLIRYPVPFEPRSPDVELFAEVSRALGAEAVEAALAQVRAEPDEVEALYQLGYELIEHDLNGVAAAVLERTRTLAPSSPRVLSELVAALERDLNHPAAVAALRGAPDLVAEDFLCRYLLAFNAALTGDLDEPRRLLPSLLGQDDPRYTGMPERVAGLLARADALRGRRPLDEDDLLGWHFVITGGVLLHRSGEGREVMRGRYAWVQDSTARCLEGLRKLQAVLEACERPLARVYALPDPHGAALAEAAAHLFDLPLEPWPEGGSEQPGLVVAYDLSQVGEGLRPLLEHRPGQVLFAHATEWTRDFPLAADLTTFLYQVNRSPWDPRLVVEEGEVVRRGPRPSPLEERAREVVRAELPAECLSDLPELLALVDAARTLPAEHAPGLLRALDPSAGGAARERYWAGSPVRSNRFV